MMNDKKLDCYLRTYQLETDQAPSRQLMDDILVLSEQRQKPQGLAFPWQWFDLMIPKTVGWVLTCFLGIYLGLFSSVEQGTVPTDEEYFSYDQAQVFLVEDIYVEAGDK
ncbi:MAG: hypothetical protein JKY45_07425 [Emcibacter sp.]|nr:hypothetical protein [Emcibacter sp.]